MSFHTMKACFFLFSSLIIVILLTSSGLVYGTEKKILLLSEKEVLKKVLSSSPFIKKIKLTKQKNLSRLLEKKYSFSNWEAFSNFTQSKRKNPQISVFESKEKQIENFNLGLKKKLPLWFKFKIRFFKSY